MTQDAIRALTNADFSQVILSGAGRGESAHAAPQTGNHREDQRNGRSRWRVRRHQRCQGQTSEKSREACPKG